MGIAVYDLHRVEVGWRCLHRLQTYAHNGLRVLVEVVELISLKSL